MDPRILLIVGGLIFVVIGIISFLVYHYMNYNQVPISPLQEQEIPMATLELEAPSPDVLADINKERAEYDKALRDGELPPPSYVNEEPMPLNSSSNGTPLSDIDKPLVEPEDNNLTTGVLNPK